jgi:putative transposase
VDHLNTNNSKIALDLGTKDLYTSEQGVKVKGPTHQTYYRLQIANLQQLKEKCKNGSRRHKHLSKLIRKLYLKMARKTNDYLHKVSHALSKKYDTVIVEDLSVKQMGESKIRARNRQIHDSCMSKFVSMLEYKCKHLIKVNPEFTSQTCCVCHTKLDKKLPLNKRVFKCPHCGLKLDRDHNAAVNILQLGYAHERNDFHKHCTILDIPEMMFIDDDTRKCLEQAIA